MEFRYGELRIIRYLSEIFMLEIWKEREVIKNNEKKRKLGLKIL